MNANEIVRAPMEHEIKCWPEYFQAVKEGRKPFEIRKWDRPYAVGDTITLEEYDPQIGDYTGDAIVRQITYLFDLAYLPGDNVPHFAGYVALGLDNPTDADLRAELTASQRRERAAVENYNVLVGLIAERLSAGSFEKLCELADELEVFVTDWRGPQEAGKGEAHD